MTSATDAISVSGPVLAFPDGYGDVVRQFALGVREMGCACQLRDTSLGQRSDPETLDPEFQPLRELLAANVETPFNLVFTIPELFERSFSTGKINIGYTMWETDRLPRRWPPLCNRMDALQVPSRFCKEVFERSGVTVPIQVVPVPVDTCKFDDMAPAPLLSTDKQELTFYSIFQWHERKNPTALIAAFVQAFDAHDAVRLVLKTHLGGGSEEKDAILKQASEIAAATAKGRGLPTIVVIPGRVAHEQVVQLHLQSDVYVGPVRGEGFGLPMFDAALAGNHVIATRFSSPLDYLEVHDESGQELYDLLDYQLIPVNRPGDGLYTRDQQWADVNVEELATRLRRCYVSWRANGCQLPRQQERQRHVARVREQWHRLNSVRMSLQGFRSLARSPKPAPQVIRGQSRFPEAVSATATESGARGSSPVQVISIDEFHRRYGNPDTSRAVYSFTKPIDTHVVLALLSHARARRILEIGTALGHMTANLTEWSPEEACVFTLGTIEDLSVGTDGPQSCENPSRANFGYHTNHFGKAHKAFFITADSLHYDFRRLAPLDFAFIDGAHDFAHVHSDSLKAYQELSPNGFMIWHDFNSAVPWVQVRQAIEQIRFPEIIYHVAQTEVAFLQKHIVSSGCQSQIVPISPRPDRLTP
jgi:hypothetical protein